MLILLLVKLLCEVTCMGFAVVTIVATGGGAETIVDGTVVVFKLLCVVFLLHTALWVASRNSSSSLCC